MEPIFRGYFAATTPLWLAASVAAVIAVALSAGGEG
jgi:hypothetical protein